MRVFLVASFLLSLVLVQATNPGHKQQTRTLSFPEPNRLSAAILSSKLTARGEHIFPLLNREASFDYVADVVENEPVFATTLNVESQWPILTLEDWDIVLNSVACTESQMGFSFASVAAEEDFERTIRDTPDFIIVTSHEDCDLEGERSAHRVSSVNVLKNHTVVLEKTRIAWHDAFSSTKVSFTRRHPSQIQRRDHTVVRRQHTSTGPFPPAPTEADGLNTSAEASFNRNYIDREIYPVDLPGADEMLPQYPVIVRCKTCAIRGEIQLSQGQFNIEEEDSLFDIDEAYDFFTEGAIELLVKEFSSEIELDFELASEGPLIELAVELPAIGLTPFQIAGVVTFGPQIVPEFIITADLEGDIGFSYGFNVTVPDYSRILINMTTFNQSEITGFENTTFTPLPFEASTEVTSIELGIAFRPKFLLGISSGIDVLDVDIDGGIGAFVSLPSLSLNVSHLTDVTESCDDAVGTDDIFGNATLLVPSVEFDMGIIAGFDVRIMDFPNIARETAPVLASTSWDLPTACVSFKPEVRVTSTSGVLASLDTIGNDSDSEEDNDNAAGLRGRSTALLCVMILLAVAAGFCGWG
ncbi:hypothetical protein BJX70DRAFT_408255 [Aspergillus crustosus]